MRSSACSRLRPSRVDEELGVALGPLNGALGQAFHAPARLRLEPGGDALAHRAMERGIAHHATLADLALAALELRLDERDETPRARTERQPTRPHAAAPHDPFAAPHKFPPF